MCSPHSVANDITAMPYSPEALWTEAVMIREYRGRLPHEWTKAERDEVIWELWCAGASLNRISQTVGLRFDTVDVKVEKRRRAIRAADERE
jgi:hypothetical protein